MHDNSFYFSVHAYLIIFFDGDNWVAKGGEMKRTTWVCLLVVAVVLAAGCGWYFSGGAFPACVAGGSTLSAGVLAEKFIF